MGEPTTDLLDEMMARIIARMSVISEQRARSYEGIPPRQPDERDQLYP